MNFFFKKLIYNKYILKKKQKKNCVHYVIIWLTKFNIYFKLYNIEMELNIDDIFVIIFEKEKKNQLNNPKNSLSILSKIKIPFLFSVLLLLLISLKAYFL